MPAAAAVNLAIVVAYLFAMLGVGMWLTRYVRSEDDYFIAGRSLNRWAICGSVMATNVAAVYLVGPAGRAYSGGAALLLMAWTGNMLAAISAVTFLPRFRRLGITTLSELLQRRYGSGIAMAISCMWMLFYALFSGVTMLTCATVLTGAFGGGEHFEMVLIGVAVVVIMYCLFSGLLAVVYTDLLQAFLIILGAVILLPLGLKAGGGIEVLFDPAKIAPEKWLMWRPAGQPDDYLTMLMLLVLGLPYWFTSQYMLQRSFAGRNVEEASKGLLWAALLTGPLTLCYIVPVMVAGVNPELQPPTGSADSVLPMLVQKLMPIGLGGIFLAALVAASNSTASSYLNSLATLFERDLYRPANPDRSTKHYLLVGRVVTMLAGGMGLIYAVLCHRSEMNLLDSAWMIGSIFQPAIFVVIAGALFFRRGTTVGAWACLVIGIGYAAVGAFGGWAAIGDALQLSHWPIFAWDHTKAPTRALVGMPLSAVVLILGSLCTSKRASDENRAAEHEVWLNRMRFAPGDWTPKRRAGFGLGMVCLVGMIVAAIFDRDLPKPWNVPIFLGLLSGFVAGVLLAAGRFLPAEETEMHTRAAIEDSRFARYLATGWTWAAVYAVAMVLVVALYVLL
ncbi:Sodium/glucose cotransporter [Symmachiella macrocystis]|uniref:Sodium/glucose cotransporter n=1 Tax=Symmachiella macrocystis TaxID=2527985 RepID=A0A5C6B7B5_9PLAN|nr:sodium:solute symporter family protein [Symmachiella macrocystis]TWU07186.1 Sodium/glucose cotransporter [Symmachiella macrocystis]